MLNLKSGFQSLTYQAISANEIALGMYVIDDMLPQANWPEGHAEKVDNLIATLEQLRGFWVTKLSWASGIIVATKR
ncbi:MAG: hypothetical protein DCF25_19940 [Leptolyngbya foveolarum]|uniref:Methyltransferase n=1 Tax=Leptolyngbya foveolarum TaxID=47253 RepID=A0A2W4VNH4_9CYAN|nr:MAG: hypothetical protein DCF25_19940 [Leptolyngbya foveolarum]